jgi:hypothetical protein
MSTLVIPSQEQAVMEDLQLQLFHVLVIIGYLFQQPDCPIAQQHEKGMRKFNLWLATLPEKVLELAMDIVDNVPADFPSDTLKDYLLETHMLSDQEKLDVLFKMEPLGGHKLSQPLASMLAYCLPAMEQISMFQFMFL